MSDNDGDDNPSRARDHLANERTYLAWLRTGAEVMVVGLVIAKFSGASASSFAAGGVLIGLGVVGLVYATIRYRRRNAEIEHNEFVIGSRGQSPLVASVVLIAGVLAALGLLIASASH